jgi:hypothetical protein
LISGRFAMFDDGAGFSLVPWSPVLEQRIGRTIAGIVRGSAATWDFHRQPSIAV